MDLRLHTQRMRGMPRWETTSTGMGNARRGAWGTASSMAIKLWGRDAWRVGAPSSGETRFCNKLLQPKAKRAPVRRGDSICTSVDNGHCVHGITDSPRQPALTTDVHMVQKCSRPHARRGTVARLHKLAVQRTVDKSARNEKNELQSRDDDD